MNGPNVLIFTGVYLFVGTVVGGAVHAYQEHEVAIGQRDKVDEGLTFFAGGLWAIVLAVGIAAVSFVLAKKVTARLLRPRLPKATAKAREL